MDESFQDERRKMDLILNRDEYVKQARAMSNAAATLLLTVIQTDDYMEVENQLQNVEAAKIQLYYLLDDRGQEVS